MKKPAYFIFIFALVFCFAFSVKADEQNALEASLTEDEISDTEDEFNRIRAEAAEAKDPAKAGPFEREEVLESGESELNMD